VPARRFTIYSSVPPRQQQTRPFVAILRNLRPQLAAGALVVPERVTIELALLDA
jgi:hypothetical protein